MSRLSDLLGELKRRRVYHVAVVYAATAFVAAQAAEIFLPRLGLPDWTVTLVVVLAVAGFPVALILGWVFDITPAGLQRSDPQTVAEAQPGQWRVAGGTAAAVLVLVAAGWWLSNLAFSPSPLPANMRIAVLPFHPVGDDERARALADGLAESLSSRLSQLDGIRGTLWVIPTAEIRQRGITSPSLARREFGVNLSITGSVRYTGDSVWVEANLVDAEELRQLRSWTLDEPLSDVAAIQNGILRSFRDLLDLELDPVERRALTSGGTEDPGAFDHQLAARGYLERSELLENVNEAIRLFRMALDRDPNYVLALSGLAKAHLRKHRHSLDPSEIERGRDLIDRALALDDGVAQVHLTRGLIRAAMGQQQAAVESFRKALELEPFSEEALRALGTAYNNLGQIDRAEETLRRAVELRPGWWPGYNALGGFYYRHGRYEESLEQFRRVLVLTPDNSVGWSNVGIAYFQLGQWDETFEALERSVGLSPTRLGLSNLGTLYYHRERYEDAARSFEAALELSDRSFTIWSYLAATYERIPGREAHARAAWLRTVETAQIAFEINPQDPDIVLTLASAYAHLDEQDRARRLLRGALEWGQGDIEFLYRVGEIHERIGDREEAIRWFSEALRRGYSREAFDREDKYADLRADPRFLDAMAH
jgi:tetratricopeptide (TPR) repeat protein